MSTESDRARRAARKISDAVAKANANCSHEYRKWIEAGYQTEDGQLGVTRYWTCPDCGKRGRT